MKKLSLLSLFTCLFLVACSSVTPAPTPINPTPVPIVTIDPTALALIQTGSSVACGAVLNFAITDPNERTKVANEMYSAANAIYSLSIGTLPTVAQFQSTILAFGGNATDANYATFTSSLTALYTVYYNKYNTGDVSNANQVLASLAAGIQAATSSYVVTPVPTVVSTGTTTD